MSYGAQDELFAWDRPRSDDDGWVPGMCECEAFRPPRSPLMSGREISAEGVRNGTAQSPSKHGRQRYGR